MGKPEEKKDEKPEETKPEADKTIWVNLVFQNKNLCLSAKNEGDAIQVNCGGSEDLLWRVAPIAGSTNGEVRLISKNGHVLSYGNQKPRNGGQILSGEENIKNQEFFRITAVKNQKDIVHLRTATGNSCVDNMGRWSRFGGKVHQWSCHDYNRNQWMIVRPYVYKAPFAPKNEFNIVTKNGFCLSSLKEGEKITQNECDGTEPQTWKAEIDGESLILRNHAGRVMDGRDPKRGGKVFGIVDKANEDYNGINWVFEEIPFKKNHYRLRNYRGGQCVDDVGGRRLNFWVHFWNCHNHNRNQWFTLRDPQETLKMMKEKKRMEEENAKKMLERIPKDFSIITKNGFCLSSLKEGEKITQNECNGTETQTWKVEIQGGSFVLQNHAGRVMDGADPRRGGKVYGITRETNKKYNGINWVFEEVPFKKNHFRLRNARGNQCVDDVGGRRLNFWVHFWNCHNHNRNQWFTLRTPQEVLKMAMERKQKEFENAKKMMERIPKGYFNIITKNGFCLSS